MSFDVVLQYSKEDGSSGDTCVSQQKRIAGGTYVMGGTNDCELNITYNYSVHYHEIFPIAYAQKGNGQVAMETTGLRWLTDKTGAEAIPILESCVERLGTKRSEDYWKATMGNAGYALSILLEWAREFPEARFWVY